jgi:hypothetical protein
MATNCQDRKCAYYITLWHNHVTTVAMETQQCNACNEKVHFTIKNTTLSVAQCFYGKLLTPAAPK